MKARKLNILSMQNAVISFYKKTPVEIINLIPDFDSQMQLLITKNKQISKLNGRHSSSIKGYSQDKLNAKEVLITKAMTVVFAMRALALKQKDNVLLEKSKAITKTKLNRYRGSTTASTVEQIITMATAIQPSLQPYGITTSLLAEVKSALDTFSLQLSKPRNQIVARKSLLTQIEVLFKECSTIFYHLDTLVNTIANRQPAFKSEYFFNRKIINYHGKKLAVRGYIKDVNGNPIQKVEIKVLDTNQTTKTTARGYFQFKTLPVGIQTLSFNKINYKQNITIIGITKGERKQINITLQNQTTEQHKDVA